MRLATYFLSKFGRLLLTVFVISSTVFVLVRVIPGDPALVVAGMDAGPDELSAIRHKLGTDVPVALQYFRWLRDLLRLDFGVSLVSGQNVATLIVDRFPLTFALAFLGLAVAILIAIPLGVLSAVHRWSAWDYLGMAVSQIGMALPSFWLGILLLLVFSVKLRLFPMFGSGGLRHLILPALSLGIARAAVLLRLARASMIVELDKEYIVTARAKGLTEGMVRYKHALKNALLPIVTIAGIQLGYMLGGAIIVEQVFSLPGIGRLLLTAAYQRDFPLIQGGVAVVAAIFSLVNFGVDLIYGVLNPKIKTIR